VPDRRAGSGSQPARALALVLAVAACASPAAAAPWTLDLADSVQVATATVRLADVARAPVPATAAQVVVASGGRPGGSLEITARGVLRRLVVAGCADGVARAGAERCRIAFGGAAGAPDVLVERIRAALAPQVPPPAPEAPPSWLELSVPEVAWYATGEWDVVWPSPRALVPGRNLVTLEVREGARGQRLAVVAVLHAFARTAVPVAVVPRGQGPQPDALRWQWTDLALADPGVVTDPRALADMIAARDLAPGAAVRERDLAPRPLVRRGETIDLVARRGAVAAKVRVECRQDGLLGQDVSVLNTLNGRLLVARVAAAGLVTLER